MKWNVSCEAAALPISDAVVSDKTTFRPPAVDVITRSFRTMAVINDEEFPTDGQRAFGMETLNSMVKELEATGIHVWTEEEAILFLQQYQVRYLIGGRTPDHCADANEWILAVLATNAAPADNTITLEDATGILNCDQIGITTDAGFIFWTTVKGAPVGDVVTLATPIPANGTTTAGALVFDYTENIVRPLRVPYARRLLFANEPNTGQGPIITPLAPMLSRQEYFDLPQPKTPGLVNQAYYNPARDQGEFFVWNAPSNVAYGIRFTYYRPIFNFCATVNLPDIPDEWGNTLMWNLAAEMSPTYNVSQVRYDRIVARAASKLELVMGWDREPQSVYFGRASRYSRG